MASKEEKPRAKKYRNKKTEDDIETKVTTKKGKNVEKENVVEISNDESKSSSEAEVITTKASKKRKCAYGKNCYRKNEDHLKNYEHPGDNDEEEDIEEKKEKKQKKEDVTKTETKASNDSKAPLESETKETDKEKFDLENVDDIRSFVFEQNKMKMPDDFYEFLEFCKSIDPKDPKNALKSIDIQLVGIYDLILNGLKVDYKLYYRYYYDPPEFQTVLKGNDDNMLHFGYFRDDPNEMPGFVAINEAKVDCKITPKGENLFSALNWYLDDCLNDDENKSKSNDIKDIKKKLTNWCNKNKIELNLKTAKLKARDKRCNCKTFHEAGICVAVDERGFGYREVPETYDSLRKMFTNFCAEGTAPNIKAKKSKAEDSIQELVTLTQFANDESDYGMTLELGLCMFSFGNQALHKYIKNLLPVSYILLNRNHYADIIKAHLNKRLMKIVN